MLADPPQCGNTGNTTLGILALCLYWMLCKNQTHLCLWCVRHLTDLWTGSVWLINDNAFFQKHTVCAFM